MTTFRVVRALDAVPAAAWDALHDGGNPFVRHAFLAGLEETGCLRPSWGWRAHHATLWDGEDLVAAAPAYLKANSHGEFVFDFAWANAYERAGLDYYPKWLVGVPYTPATGPRLLAATPEARQALVEGMAAHARALGLSSLHLNFLPENEAATLGAPWLARSDVQFQWRNAGGWRDFDDFLGALSHKKRKNIRQERGRVAAAGYRFRVVDGHGLREGDLARMHALYLRTFAEYGNSPALTLAFFEHLAQAMPEALVLVLAERGDGIVAGALCLRGRDTLYGRYWGAEETSPGLHFETCYYQGIDYCLRAGLARFEPGAQGEHKLARGFLPVLTHSRHRIFDPEFETAIGAWCEAELASIAGYRDLAARHSPFRTDDAAADPAC
ncbi:GNAT family N-acetyltransferase [Coralloluteibacterium thermophilus]|uniref:GNAT family N-acetyltransferase n=1 Tax=Coralloluteibacterium thermophilum TaxID=2707049 RepID=A0ABV9NMB0_9GAMM